MLIKITSRNLQRFLFVPLLFCCPGSFAQSDSSLGGVANNLFGATMHLHDLIKVICITAGIGVILGGIVRYRKYRRNPLEASLGSAITNFIIGIFLIILAFIPITI